MLSEQNVNKQIPMFFEDIHEAISTDVAALGGKKAVGSMLWGESQTPDKAGEKLSNCLNSEHRQKLSLNEMLVIQREARKIGSYATAHFIASETGFTQPQPIEPEDEKAKLQTQFIQAIKAAEQLSKKMERFAK